MLSSVFATRATPHVVCPFHTCLFSWQHCLHPICWLSLATPILPAHLSTGLVPSLRTGGQQGASKVLGKHPLWGGKWRKLHAGSCPYSMWGQEMCHPGSTTCTVWVRWSCILSHALGPDLPCIYKQDSSPSCFSLPFCRTAVITFTCYCTGALSAPISLVFMQSFADSSLNTSRKYYYYCLLQMATALAFSRHAPLTIY